MRHRKVINENVAESTGGVNVAGSVNAAVVSNVNEPGGSTHVSSKQRTKIVQRGGRTEVFESTTETEGVGDDDEES